MKRVGAWIDAAERNVIAYLMAGMALVTFSQVVLRFVFNSGFVWALELTTVMFAWLILFGMSYGVKIGAHLGVDAFVKLFNPSTQRFLGMLAVLGCLLYCGLLLFGAIEYWERIYRLGIGTEDLYVPRVLIEAFGRYEEEVPIPRYTVYFILPLGLALLTLRFLEAAWRIVTGKSAGIGVADEAADMFEEQAEHAKR